MNITGIGLDYLGAKSWSVQIKPGEVIESPNEIHKSLPTAILPIQRGEKPITGFAADNHRRGRGLKWPPESQIPPFGETSNGCGRVPLCALFEMLCNGEQVWGKLSDEHICWKPDGITKVSMSAAKLIAQQIDDIVKPNTHIGLAVPDALGIGGQQLLLSSIRNSRTVLVPRSIAAVIGHCRSTEDKMPKGHIIVVDTSFGSWSVARVPVDSRRGPDGEDWNVPVSDANLRKIKLPITGWSLLQKAMKSSLNEMLSPNWANDVFSGSKSLSLPNEDYTFPDSENYNWHSPLINPSSILKGIAQIQNSLLAISCDRIYSRNLGLMVIGPLASVKFEHQSLSEIITRKLQSTLIEVEESTIALGASWAAAGTVNNWPTWLEQMEQLELHFIGSDNIGNLTNLWKEVIPEMLVDAGKEYKNPTPINRIKLSAGSDKVRVYLRRPLTKTKDSWIYREVLTKPGKVHSDDIPLQINVRARPGQGFASVLVTSIEQDLFESLLDWENMLEANKPDEPAKGYIEKAVTLKAAPELWSNCSEYIIRLNQRLTRNYSADEVTDACKLLTRRLNKAITAENYQRGYGKEIIPDQFSLYTPMGRDTIPAGDDADDSDLLIDDLKVAMCKWVKNNPYERPTIGWIKKTAGWLYLGCPDEFINQAFADFYSINTSVDEMSLHIAGLCMNSDQQFLDFFTAFKLKMPQSSAPNNWMKALRNLIKFNENSLKHVHIDLVELMFELSIQKLEWAHHNYKPIITHNALQAIFFLLKYRRYNRSFISKGTTLHTLALNLARDIEKRTTRVKTGDDARKFITFLNWEGKNEDLTGFFEDEED